MLPYSQIGKRGKQWWKQWLWRLAATAVLVVVRDAVVRVIMLNDVKSINRTIAPWQRILGPFHPWSRSIHRSGLATLSGQLQRSELVPCLGLAIVLSPWLVLCLLPETWWHWPVLIMSQWWLAVCRGWYEDTLHCIDIICLIKLWKPMWQETVIEHVEIVEWK